MIIRLAVIRERRRGEKNFEWGILFLFHFYKGRFVGEVMTPVAALVSGVRSNDDACYARETVFVGDFNEDGQLSRGTLFEDHCLFGDKAQEDVTVEVFSTFGSPPGEPKLVHVKESDRDIVCHRPRSNGTETSWKLLLLDSLRSNMISPRSSESFKSQVKAIWDSMASTNDHPSQKSQHLYFSYVDGPVQNPGAFEYHEGMPIIRPDKDDPMAALRAQIMGRQKQRHTSMVDMLAEKYGGGSTKGGNKKKRGRK